MERLARNTMRSTTLRGSAATAANPCPVHPTCLEVHSFEILNKYRSPGHETASPEYSGSRNPAQKKIRMKDVLFHNFFGYKGHKTASAPCPTETLRGICPSALFRQTVLPRGILHLIIFSARTSLHKTNFVVRLSQYKTIFMAGVCEGVFMLKRNEGKKTSEAAS
jgi:hypothetical protein